MTKELVIKRLKLLSENKGIQTLNYDEARILLAEIERLNNNKDNAINFIDQVLMYHLHDYKQLDEDINTLIGILRGSDKE